MSGLLPPIPEYTRAPRCGEHAKMAARNNFDETPIIFLSAQNLLQSPHARRL